MCMQTTFGCCFVDGKVIEKDSKKTKQVKKSTKKKNTKKVIYQTKVEFE